MTSVSAEAVSALHDLIRKDAHALDAASQQRLRRHFEKLTNATQSSAAERTLLQEQNRFLTTLNNEAKVRRSTKATIIGKVRVMSYGDLEKARTERSAKDGEREARKAQKMATKSRDSGVRSKTKAAHSTQTVQCEQFSGAHGVEVDSIQLCGDEMQEGATVSVQRITPVAKML